MRIYAISDLHLDSTGEKSMDIFGGNWVDHQDLMFENIEKTINTDDIVLIPGDISWGLKIEEAYVDLIKLDRLPGRKILGKGNHDYWWSTKSKLNALDLKTIDFIQTNSFVIDNIGIAGTRGWMSRDSESFDENDEKIYSRELNRLDISLSELKNQELEKKIVMLHYPPFNFKDLEANDFVDLMEKHEVDICVYGHLHSEGHKFKVEGEIRGIEFHLVSCDYLNLEPKLIY